ncbi:MAG: hypothetical protein ACI9KE_005807 [Polyangiales bacterium]|jgi:hypothetical protein
MTDVNKHNPYPEIATIRCPRCANATEFRRAVSLTNGKSWAWWQPRLWPCAAATDWTAKERWAPGDPQPGWRGWIVIEHDPSLYRWKQPTHGYTANDDGVVSCIICVGRRKHVLDWPSDAYYRFDLPQGSLWAWSREGAEALIEFIASTKRDCGAHGPHYLFLRHIPSAFLGAKDRQAIVSRLRRELSKL